MKKTLFTLTTIAALSGAFTMECEAQTIIEDWSWVSDTGPSSTTVDGITVTVAPSHDGTHWPVNISHSYSTGGNSLSVTEDARLNQSPDHWDFTFSAPVSQIYFDIKQLNSSDDGITISGASSSFSITAISLPVSEIVGTNMVRYDGTDPANSAALANTFLVNFDSPVTSFTAGANDNSGTTFIDSMAIGDPTTVPEPSSAALLGLAGTVMLLRKRR